MAYKVYTYSEVDKELKKAYLKKKFQDKVNKAVKWIMDNKEIVLFIGPAVVGVVTTGVKAIGKNVNLRKEQNIKNLYCYDRSLGHYWALRRELSNKEWVEIDKRKRNGERLADILDELKVLK